MRNPRKFAYTIITTILITLIALLFLFPLVWMIASSLKPEAQIYNNMDNIKAFLPSFHINQWGTAYQSLLARFNILGFIINSLIYAFGVTAGSIIVNSLAGYGFSKFTFKGQKFVFGLLIATLVIPGETIIIQKFQIVKLLGIINTPWAVIFPSIAAPFYIYMFKNFFDAISSDVIESAEMEGAGTFTIYWKIMMPMAKPAMATVGTLSFIGSWNDYIWPLMVLTDSNKFPLQVAITNINSTAPVYMNQVMAILTISTIPLIIVYLFFQRYLVQGLGVAGNGDK
ncbi:MULTISPECIES: carbohydrate ABC transporter permease [Oenococcus]|uniref:Multiple sugar ABC membrane-spanning permease protein n=1 Tax=Oenococcus kitaharae DSM 17330 TaxID=1045004 RepID=G9WF78_9LACO|nr:carbohydrate ABC transporter permease [Oenococcus kitaharae]EHN58798.1 Multiple sugar ABC membrane-spanning permease protein [Oenococcus kitaharae DSM 17330]OEY81860.1 ABC transporter permease [Oenococcus kitaharae]OEY84089.1 ABC transporter permease [Oenococcus kitaharae]OEY85551.1 ABC transporter permease [Oenococcus kitaharae]